MLSRPAWALMLWLITTGAAQALTMLQDRLLYFPERAALDAVVVPPWQPWPARDAFRGLLLAPAGPVRATVVVFHGNAGHAGHRVHYGAALAPLGLRTILAEYPGYGPRAGALGEESLAADAAQTIALARERFGAPLLVIGESLGAGVAAAAAARRPAAVDGLMLITPWDRLRSVATHHYPWLPVGWLLRDRYDSVRNLLAFRGPKLVVVAGSDAIVPPAFGRALAEALPGPKRLLTIEGAGHNDWPDHVDGRWWADAIDWLLGAPASR
ncbi:MAG: alpha/beta fold hydrolase [Rubrivivax sp.]